MYWNKKKRKEKKREGWPLLSLKFISSFPVRIIPWQTLKQVVLDKEIPFLICHVSFTCACKKKKKKKKKATTISTIMTFILHSPFIMHASSIARKAHLHHPLTSRTLCIVHYSALVLPHRHHHRLHPVYTRQSSPTPSHTPEYSR